MEKMNVEQTWYFDDKDEDLQVECAWRFPYSSADEDIALKLPNVGVEILLSHRQAKEFAENLMNAVMNLPSKSSSYASDKTKGDAFEALRRAEE